MLEDEIRKVAAEMIEAGKKPSVRSVREAVGRGSHTDIGDILRRIQEEQDRLKFALKEVPNVLQSQATILVAELWKAAQEISNRSVEDVRHGCEIRLAEATAQAKELATLLDQAETTIFDLKAELENSSAHVGRILAEAHEAQLKIVSLEGEVRSLTQVANRREQELERAISAFDAATKAIADTNADTKARLSPAEEMMDNSVAPKEASMLEASQTKDAAQIVASTEMTFHEEGAQKSDAKLDSKGADELCERARAIIAVAAEPLSSAEILDRLDVPGLKLRQLYNMLYKRSCVGGLFVSAGDGKFSIREADG